MTVTTHKKMQKRDNNQAERRFGYPETTVFFDRTTFTDDEVASYSQMVAINLKREHWEAAHAAIDAAKREADLRKKLKPLDTPLVDALGPRIGGVLNTGLGVSTLRELRRVSKEAILGLRMMGQKYLDIVTAVMEAAVKKEAAELLEKKIVHVIPHSRPPVWRCVECGAEIADSEQPMDICHNLNCSMRSSS